MAVKIQIIYGLVVQHLLASLDISIKNMHDPKMYIIWLNVIQIMPF